MNVQFEAIKSITAEAVNRYFDGYLNKKKRQGMDKWLRDFYPEHQDIAKNNTEENRVLLFELLVREAITNGRARQPRLNASALSLTVSATVQGQFDSNVRRQQIMLAQEKAFNDKVDEMVKEGVQWFRKHQPQIIKI